MNRKETFPPWPSYTQEEAEAVSRVLMSNKVNYWTGNEGREFEKEFAAYCGCRHAVALSNGTVALEIALEALGIGAGDEVVIPCYTFIATASAVVMQGAVPVAADVDRDSLTITSETIADKLTPRTKAIIPVHLMGHPCDMEPIMALSEKHGLKVVEDCAQAHGARYKGVSVGTIGHVGAWSFCQDKIMTTGGEGGMVTTNDKDIWSRMWSYKDHGKSWGAVCKKDHKPGFRWLHESFGTNARMTEIQAVLGRIQLRRMPEWLERRRKNATILIEGLRALPGIEIHEPTNDVEHAYYKFYAFIDDALAEIENARDILIERINAYGVPCFSGVCPEIYREKAFDRIGFTGDRRLPVARDCGERSLMFLVHPALGESEMLQTITAVKHGLSGLLDRL